MQATPTGSTASRRPDRPEMLVCFTVQLKLYHKKTYCGEHERKGCQTYRCHHHDDPSCADSSARDALRHVSAGRQEERDTCSEEKCPSVRQSFEDQLQRFEQHKLNVNKPYLSSRAQPLAQPPRPLPGHFLDDQLRGLRSLEREYADTSYNPLHNQRSLICDCPSRRLIEVMIQAKKC